MKNAILFILVFTSGVASAAVHKLTPVGGAVEVLAIGKPAFIKIRGKGAPPSGEIRIDGKKVSGAFEFDVASIDTGIGLRNEHMRDKYLHVKEHPKAKLEITQLE